MNAKVMPLLPNTAVTDLLDPEYGRRFSSCVVVNVSDIAARVGEVLAAEGAD